MTKSKSKTVLLTGGASGIGAATARSAALRGYRVLISDIDLEGAQALARDIGAGATATRLDITSDEQWEQVLDEAWNLYGGLDVLINNAGIAHPGNAATVTTAEHQRTLDINFMGPLRGMLAALPRFKSQGSGHFVTVCSMSAFLPFPGLASYSASKHALRAFHHAMALEERKSPVKFTIVHPTATETPMLEQEAENDDVALAFVGASVTPEFVADVVLTAMAKQTVEVFMPPDRAQAVRRVGTSPRALLNMVLRGEDAGRRNQEARRAAKAQASAGQQGLGR